MISTEVPCTANAINFLHRVVQFLIYESQRIKSVIHERKRDRQNLIHVSGYICNLFTI